MSLICLSCLARLASIDFVQFDSARYAKEITWQFKTIMYNNSRVVFFTPKGWKRERISNVLFFLANKYKKHWRLF